jgi:hypothetical protein
VRGYDNVPLFLSWESPDDVVAGGVVSTRVHVQAHLPPFVLAELEAYRVRYRCGGHAQERVADQFCRDRLVGADHDQRGRPAFFGCEQRRITVEREANQGLAVQYQDFALQGWGELQFVQSAHAHELCLHVTALGKGLRVGGQRFGAVCGEKCQLCRTMVPARTRIVLHLDLCTASSEMRGDVFDGALVRLRAAQARADLLA